MVLLPFFFSLPPHTCTPPSNPHLHFCVPKGRCFSHFLVFSLSLKLTMLFGSFCIHSSICFVHSHPSYSVPVLYRMPSYLCPVLVVLCTYCQTVSTCILRIMHTVDNTLWCARFRSFSTGGILFTCLCCTVCDCDGQSCFRPKAPTLALHAFHTRFAFTLRTHILASFLNCGCLELPSCCIPFFETIFSIVSCLQMTACPATLVSQCARTESHGHAAVGTFVVLGVDGVRPLEFPKQPTASRDMIGVERREPCTSVGHMAQWSVWFPQEPKCSMSLRMALDVLINALSPRAAFCSTSTDC